MPKLAALALVVGVLAVIDTWLFALPALANLHMQVWISFIAWGAHFMAGGKTTGVKASILSMSFGALVGMCAALVAGGVLAGLGGLAVPVAVGLGAAVIVVASKVPTLEAIPAGFYGFACIFGLLAVVKPDSPTAGLLPSILSFVVGGAFGYVSEIVTDLLARKDIALEPGVGQPAGN